MSYLKIQNNLKLLFRHICTFLLLIYGIYSLHLPHNNNGNGINGARYRAHSPTAADIDTNNAQWLDIFLSNKIEMPNNEISHDVSLEDIDINKSIRSNSNDNNNNNNDLKRYSISSSMNIANSISTNSKHKSKNSHKYRPISPTSSSSSSSSSKTKGTNDNAWVHPSIGAWRVVGINDEDDTPPTLRSYLYGTVGLKGVHLEKVEDLWESIRRRGSLRHFSDEEKEIVKSALATSYVALYGKTTKRSLEACIDRARGTAAVLGELRADLNVVVTGILHEVFPIVYGLEPVENKSDSNMNSQGITNSKAKAISNSNDDDDNDLRLNLKNRIKSLKSQIDISTSTASTTSTTTSIPTASSNGLGFTSNNNVASRSHRPAWCNIDTNTETNDSGGNSYGNQSGIRFSQAGSSESDGAYSSDRLRTTTTTTTTTSTTTTMSSGSSNINNDATDTFSASGWQDDQDQWLIKPASLLERNHFEEAAFQQALALTKENSEAQPSLSAASSADENYKAEIDIKQDLIDVLDAEAPEDTKDQENLDEMSVIREAMTKRFGADVMTLGHAYCKLPKFMSRRAVYSLKQSENHIQMLVVTAEDYRALYMRLAERLHTMRVLRSLPLEEEDLRKIAQEALHVYAPLAHKMGVMKVKGELEDLAFRVLDPDMFKRTRYTQIAANKAFHDAANAVQEAVSNDPLLREHNVTYRLNYRIKDKYQLSLKMKMKGLDNPNDVRDALGLRIILEHPQRAGESQEVYDEKGRKLTYHVVNLLRHMDGWAAHTDEQGFKDYLLNRKENGYESLHQYIRHRSLGTSVEVQVRTRSMHMNAELGSSAHWYYKDLIYRKDVADSKIYRIAWRSDAQSSGKCRSPAEMLGYAKQQLLSERVLVFLEDKSTVLNMRRGSTSLDAAFSIHTELGLSAQTVLVRGEKKKFGLNTPLCNGDVIAVRSTADGTPTAKHSWFGMIRTPHSQIALRRHFREQARSSTVALGLVRLLLGLSLNRDVPVFRSQYGSAFSIATKYAGFVTPGASSNPLSAQALSGYARRRCGCKSIAEFLFLLGTSTRHEGKALLARLLDIDSSHLAVCPPSFVTNWARLQEEAGWMLQQELISEKDANTVAMEGDPASPFTSEDMNINVKDGKNDVNADINGVTGMLRVGLNLETILIGVMKELKNTTGLEDIESAWRSIVLDNNDSINDNQQHAIKTTSTNSITSNVSAGSNISANLKGEFANSNSYMTQNASKFKKKVR